MYIYISEEILEDKSLSGDEKIVLSFIKLLSGKNKAFFGGESFLSAKFGIQGAANVLYSLVKKQRVLETASGLIYSEDYKSVEMNNYSVKVKDLDTLQAEIAGWKERGYEITKETEDSIFLSNTKNTAIVRKYH